MLASDLCNSVTPNGIANGSKVGCTSLDAETKIQASQETGLLLSNPVNSVFCNFYAYLLTGKGPSVDLLKALTNAGIKVIIH